MSPTACLERLAERDADVLDRVVRVDVQVALRLHVEVEHAVPRDLVQHVVEERHAGGELRASARRRDSSSTVIFVSAVLRSTRACARGARAVAFMRSRRQRRFQQRVVLGGRADGDAQAVREQRMPAVQVLHQDAGVLQRGEPGGASGTRTSTKLACVGKTVTTPVLAERALRSKRARSRADRGGLLREQSPLHRSSTGTTACVSALTLYGGRTLSISSIQAGCATA